MAFRYINPGYVALLDEDSGAEEVQSTMYGKNGVAFSLPNKSGDKGLTLKNLPVAEIYVMVNAYLPIGGSFEVYVPGIPQTSWAINGSGSASVPKMYLSIYINYNQLGNVATVTGADNIKSEFGIKVGEINTFLFHVKYDDPVSASLYANGQLIRSVTKSVSKFYFQSYPKVAFYSNNAYFSDVIISDEYISPKEEVIVLPIGETETDMSEADGGLYVADNVGQTLLQSVNVESLINNYGASSVVTGIALAGNPAFKTATGLASLISLSKSGGILTEHEICNVQSIAPDAGCLSGWATENLTIADLRNMQFGWKASE